MYQLAAPASAEIEVRKSRFIGWLYPLATRAEARARLAELRAQHPHAVHVCWALICEGDSGLDDDGEPSGTAARPMYNVLAHKDLFNVLAVVVRYYGGIKLGAGGLVRAYTEAISTALKSAQRVEHVAVAELHLMLDYPDEARVRRWLEQHAYLLLDAKHAERVALSLRLPAKDLDHARIALMELTQGRATLPDAG